MQVLRTLSNLLMVTLICWLPYWQLSTASHLSYFDFIGIAIAGLTLGYSPASAQPAEMAQLRFKFTFVALLAQVI